jgi:hypothetical protein
MDTPRLHHALEAEIRRIVDERFAELASAWRRESNASLELMALGLEDMADVVRLASEREDCQ